MLAQPLKGHRVGSDAALLAAVADPGDGRLVDVGAGVGAVGLALVARSGRCVADLIEIDAALAGLATENAALNGLSERARAVVADVLDPARGGRPASPTRLRTSWSPTPRSSRRGRCAPRRTRRGRARMCMRAARSVSPLLAWMRACLALLAPGGRLAMIHRPDALPAILAAAENRLGALALLPVHPRAGAPAHRLLVSGVKGSKAPLRIAPALALHGPDGRLTPEANAIHRGDRLVDWGGAAQAP